jgi:hypothetical protein
MQPTLIVDGPKSAHRVALLFDEKIDQIAVRYEGDVAFVVGEIFISRGTGERRRHRFSSKDAG